MKSKEMRSLKDGDRRKAISIPDLLPCVSGLTC